MTVGPMVGIVIPTYNEKENIEALAAEINKILPGAFIVIVDDNSPDGTSEAIKNLLDRFPVKLITRPKKMGLGSALIAGFKEALKTGADFVIEMDADFSHNPGDIPRLLEACENGADLAIGSRKVSGGKIVGWNIWRRLMSGAAMRLAKIVLGLRPKDITAGFRCYRRRVLQSINWEEIKSNGYAFQEEALYRVQKGGCKITEIPVVFVNRKKGKSKLGARDAFEFFKILLQLKFGRR